MSNKNSTNLENCYSCNSCYSCYSCNSCYSCYSCYYCDSCYSCYSCYYCDSCYSCDYCNYCNYCDSCYSCYSCYYCYSCNSCDSCYSCNSCDSCYSCYYCDYSAKLRMSERMLFCLGNEDNTREGTGYQKNNCIFNTQVTEKEWDEARNSLPTIKVGHTYWVDKADMTDDEKDDYPIYKEIGGYLKRIDYKEAWANWWKDAKRSERQAILDLPYFDAEIFKGITGIDAGKDEDTIEIEGKKYMVNGDGDVRHIEENRHGIDENDKFLGIYRTKEQAEAAAERIMSLQGATAESCTPNGDGTWTIEVTIPKKYLKAWKELSDE